MGGHNCTIAEVKLRARSWLMTAFAGAVWAQPLAVYSELAEIDPSAKVIAPESPREILSPALVRNGFTSFQVVVQAPADAPWWLFVGQNPENAVKLTMYRESGEKLEPVELPRHSAGPEVLWMDVWTAADAPVARIKIEPELQIDGDWVMYPIEARVMEAKVPSAKSEMSLCPLAPLAGASAVGRLQLRNAAQDSALASQAPKEELAKLLARCDRPAPARWSEGYLRIRDYLFRLPALH
jgi:hypothetical protein